MVNFITPVCLVCMLRPSLFFLSWYATPAVPKCPHSNKKTTHPRLYYSKYLPYIYIIQAITIPTIIFIDQITLVNAKQFHLEKILELIGIIPPFGFMLTVIAHSFTTVRIDVFNSIQAICEEHEFYAIPNLIQPQTARRVYRFIWMVIVGLTISQFFIFVLLGYRSLVTQLCTIFIIFSTCNVIGHDLVMSVLMKRLLRFCCEGVKRELLDRQLVLKKNVVKSLRRKKILYLNIIGNWERLSGGFLVLYTIYFLIGSLHLITALYCIVALQLEAETEINIQQKTYLLESSAQGVIFCVFLVIYDLSRYEIEDIVSFLLQFPTRKLRKEEELEVENFVKMLALKQPTLHISELFTVRVKLLAAMSGTTLTYVLIALQFHLHAGKRA